MANERLTIEGTVPCLWVTGMGEVRGRIIVKTSE